MLNGTKCLKVYALNPTISNVENVKLAKTYRNTMIMSFRKPVHCAFTCLSPCYCLNIHHMLCCSVV